MIDPARDDRAATVVAMWFAAAPHAVTAISGASAGAEWLLRLPL